MEMAFYIRGNTGFISDRMLCIDFNNCCIMIQNEQSYEKVLLVIHKCKKQQLQKL